MTRNEFIKVCGLFGMSLSMLQGCNALPKSTPLKPSDKVIIIGAGAAGLTAAYLLNQRCFNFG